MFIVTTVTRQSRTRRFVKKYDDIYLNNIYLKVGVNEDELNKNHIDKLYEKLETKEEPYNTKKAIDLFESDKDKTIKKESLFLVEKYVQKIRFLMKKKYKKLYCYIVIILFKV